MYPMITFELRGFLVGKKKSQNSFFFLEKGRVFMEFLLVLVKRTRREKRKSQSTVSMPRK